MIRAMRIMNANTLMSSTEICEFFIPNSVYTQCVRWKRKPIWLPTVKSKVFRVPSRPVISEEERKELQNLYNHYRTYMKSFRAYLEQVVMQEEIEQNEDILKQAEEEDFQACVAINDKWNKEVAKIREERLAQERENCKNKILQKLMEEEIKQEKKKKKIDEKIRKTKEEAVTFITAENIDAAIEECLKNVVNHNRAIDLEGNWYDGKYPSALPLEETKKPAIIEH